MAKFDTIGIFTDVLDGSVQICVWYVSGRMVEVCGSDIYEAISKLPKWLQRNFYARPSDTKLVRVKNGTRIHGQWYKPKGE